MMRTIQAAATAPAPPAPPSGVPFAEQAAQMRAQAAQMRAEAAQARTDQAQARIQEAVARKLEATAQNLERQTAGATVVPQAPVFLAPKVPEGPFIVALAGIVFVAFPLTLAIVRWIWRRTNPVAPTGPSPEMAQRLARIEQAVDAIAIEVERISEGQRFTTKLLSEGPVPSVAVPAPLRVEVPREDGGPTAR